MTLEEQIALNLGLESGATTIPISTESQLMAEAFLETINDCEEEARSLGARLDAFIEERNNEFFSGEVTLIDKFAVGLSVAATIATAVGDFSRFNFPILAARFNFSALTGYMLQIKREIGDRFILRINMEGKAMPRQARIILINTPHHIVQRGHNRGTVFVEDSDYRYYINKYSKGQVLILEFSWIHDSRPDPIDLY